MFDKRRAPRHDSTSPVTFRLDGREGQGFLVNLSNSGALFRFDRSLPFGPEAVGQEVVFTSWHDVGAILKPKGTAIRYYEEPEGKVLAVRYLPEVGTTV